MLWKPCFADLKLQVGHGFHNNALYHRNSLLQGKKKDFSP